MNINEPGNSRMLAILIQPVIAEDRRKFIRAAEDAESMDEFMLTLNDYRTIYE
jgi:hypothetical protein